MNSKRLFQLGFLFFGAFLLLSAALFKTPWFYALDNAVYQSIGEFVSPSWLDCHRMVSVLGKGVVLYSFAFVMAACLFFKRWQWEASWYLLTMVVGMILNTAWKLFFERLRPVAFDPTLNHLTFAYPSGHAFGALVFYFLSYWILLKAGFLSHKRGFPVFLSLMILWIGFSRIALGVHWFSDVLAGYLWGGAWICWSMWLAKRAKLFQRKNNLLNP